jgi:GH35 family endo-1,4-beta-xylanase
MRLRKCVVAALVALLCGSSVVVAETGTAKAQAVAEFGFASLSSLGATSTADHDAYAAQVKNTGASWVREFVAWNVVEPEPGAFNWGNVDLAVSAARASGTKVLLALIGPAPVWAQGPGPDLSRSATPADPATFGQFAAAAATRYGDYVSTWEIWNEPNDPTYFQAPDVPRYVQLLKAAHESIHSVQPGAVVVTGGVTSNPTASISMTSFIDQLYLSGAQPYLDGIGMHPYSIPYGVSDDPNHVWNDVAAARTTMVDAGDSAKKIWITEWGIPTGISAAASTEAQQAARLLDGLRTAAATPYLAPLFLFTVRDLSPDAGNVDHNFGVFRYDGSPKESALAIYGYATGGGTPLITAPTTPSS